jgi:hypothetical protein
MTEKQSLRDERMRRQGAAMATSDIIGALRAIGPTADRRWEWIPRLTAIRAAERAGQDAVSTSGSATGSEVPL